MKRVLSVGVAGLGYWGPNLARNFSQLPSARLAGLCDIDPSRLEEMKHLHPDVPKFAAFDEMLGDANLDAVVVAAPLRQHYRLAKAALLAGTHVLVEKPLASSAAECE